MLTILIPFWVKSGIKGTCQDQTKINTDNSDLWGHFPGKLKTTLKHTFSFYDYSKVTQDPKAKLSINKTITLTETVAYEDIVKKDDQVSFKVRRNYELLKNNADEKVTLPSFGLFEFLHTVSNPSSYQVGIAGLYYLSQFAESYQDNFERQVFIKINSEAFLKSEEEITQRFLSGVAQEKRHSVYSNALYGFNSLDKIYIWVKLLGDPDEIAHTDWLRTVLKLTDQEIDTIVGETSELNKFYEEYKKQIEKDFSCKFDSCHLIYRQLADTSVLTKYQITDIKELLKVFHPKQISLPSPEMNFYYPDFPGKKSIFDEIKLTGDQLYNLFDFSANNTLFNPNNMINLLGDNSKGQVSEDIKAKYGIKSAEQLDFVSSYVTQYLPKIYFFMEFENNEQKFTISGKAKTYSNLIQNYISQSYSSLSSKKDKIYSIVLKKMLDSLWKDEDKESLCPEMLQKIIGAGNRVLKICNDEYFSFISDEGLMKWTSVYSCFRVDEEGKSDCDQELLKEFMTRGVLSSKEMDGIFSEDSLGYYFDLVNKEMSESYGCKAIKCSGDELANAQYATSKVTLHPPQRITETAYSLHDWDAITFPEPFELSYFQHQYNITDEDCSDKIKEALCTLVTSDFFDAKFKEGEGYINKIKFDEITTLFLNGIVSSKISEEFGMKDMTNFYKFMQKLIELKTLSAPVLAEYKLMSILLGNSDEDKSYLDLLSNGYVYNFYKPGMEKTTGFNIKMKQSNENETLEEYTFYTKDGDTENNILRKITQMNSKSYMNVKKEDISPPDGQFISVNAPLYQFSKLDGDKKWLSDGFEYPMGDDIKNIYYFDELSTRKLQFDYKESSSYDDISCKRYNLNEDLIQGLIEEGSTSSKDYPTVYQVSNKPMIVTTENKPFYYEIEKTNKDNFFCVDEYSNMVINSNINLVYGIDTQGYGKFHSGIVEGILPVLSYNREYTVEKSSYEDVFTSISSYKTTKIVVIILGVLLAAAAIGVAIFFLMQYLQSLKKENADEEPSVNKPELIGDGSDILLPKEFKS